MTNFTNYILSHPEEDSTSQLLRYFKDNLIVDWSQQAICFELGVSIATVNRNIKKLSQLGVISTTKTKDRQPLVIKYIGETNG